MQGAAPQGPQQSTPQGPQPRQGMPMPPANDPRMAAAMDVVEADIPESLKQLVSEKEFADKAKELLMSAGGQAAMNQTPPKPPTVAERVGQKAEEGVAGLLARLSPGIQQQGQRMAMAQRRPPMQGQRPPMPQQGAAGLPARNMQGMARGGVVGYAGPDGSQVRPTPTLGAVPPSAVGDEQIKKFASYYKTLQAGLAAATTPEDKAQSQQQIQALIRDMGNQHGKVMQYLDSTKGFTIPSSQMARGGIVGYQDGGRVKRYQGTSEDGSLVEGDKAQNLRAMMQSSLPWDAAPTATAASVAENISEEEIIRLISQADDAEIARILAANFPKGSIEEQKQRKFAEVVANVNRQPAGANVIPDTGVGIASGGRGATFAPEVGVDTGGAGSPQSNIDETLRSIAALTVPETEIGDLARSPLRDPIEGAALKNIKLDASALSNTARKAEQGLASQAYAMSPEMKAAYARQQQERDAYYTAQLDPKKLKDQRINALLAGLAAPGGIARGGIEALQGVTAVGDTAAELRRKQSEERFGSAKEREGIDRAGNIKGYEAGSRMAQAVYERTSATVNQASQSLSQLATSDETRGQAAAVQEYTRQMDGLKLQLNVFLQQEKISQDDRRNLQRIVADMRNAQSDIDNTITDLRSDMLLMEDPEKTAVTALIQTANAQRGLIQQEIDTTLTSLGIDVAAKPSGGGGDVIDFTDL